MKIMFEFIAEVISGSSFAIYFCLYSDDKNICDNILWEREKIKVIGLVGPRVKGVPYSKCTQLYFMFYYGTSSRDSRLVFWNVNRDLQPVSSNSEMWT